MEEVKYSEDGKTLLRVPENYCGEFVVPEGVTTIGEAAFFGCNEIQSIRLPKSITKIEQWAFADCFSLKELIIPNTISVLEDAIFCKCGVKQVKIPTSVKVIKNNAFQYSGLTSLNLPDSVEEIGEWAFMGCRSLEKIHISSSVKKMGNAPFFCCGKIEQMTVDPSNQFFDSRDNCNAIIETSTNTLIRGCRNTIIPNTVTALEDGAFNECEGLKSISIPSSVVTIASNVFEDSFALEEVHFHHKDPNNIEFLEKWCSTKYKFNFYVPKGSENLYRQHPFFSHAKAIIGE